MPRKLLWALWWLSLTACPIAMAVIGTAFEHHGPLAFDEPRPLPTRIVDGLCVAHLVASAVASAAVFWLSRSWLTRLLAWGVVAVMIPVTAMFALGAAMNTTGTFL